MPTNDDELVQNAKAVFNSEVIINSAEDLKTKDGSIIGGGNSADTFNVKKELIIEDDKNPGYAKFNKDKIFMYTGTQEKEFLVSQRVNPTAYDGGYFNYFDIGLMLQGYYSSDAIVIGSRKNTDNAISSPKELKSGMYIGGKLLLGKTFQNKFCLQLANTSYSDDRETYGFILDFKEGTTITMPQKSGRLVVDDDLNAKQSTLYRHTVLISTPANKTAYLSFTAESDKNTPINSIENLIAVLGNTSIACSGIFRDGDPANSQSLLMINIGTSISNTTISTATIENNAITDFSNASFTDTFGSTGFTITDNVTAM